MYQWHPAVVDGLKMSLDDLSVFLKQNSPLNATKLRDLMLQKATLTLDDAEVNQLLQAVNSTDNCPGCPLRNVLQDIIDKRALVAWTTTGHTVRFICK